MKTLSSKAATADVPGRQYRIWPYSLAGLVVVVLFFGSLVAWSMTAEISGAVIAPGKLAVESNRKTVEHLDGGIVGDILVREGDRVAAGALLVRLDDTVERANLAVLDIQLTELSARGARLRAELSQSEAIAFAPELLAKTSRPEVLEIVNGERELFRARKASRDGQRRILEQRIASFHDQVKGLEAQHRARSRQISLAEQELAVIERLQKKDLAPITRVLELKSRIQMIAALRAEHATDMARAENAIGEIELQIGGNQQRFLEGVTDELQAAQTSLLDLSERHVAAAARLSRLDILAPRSGIILGLKVHTIGGVIRPGEPILDIVPETDDLILEAQVQPKDIDKVRAGLRSKIRLSAFDQQTTPEIQGTLQSISADRLEDPSRGTSYFVARIRIEPDEVRKLGDLELLPGMPAEVFIQTGERLAISYFLKPLLDNLTRAFKGRLSAGPSAVVN